MISFRFKNDGKAGLPVNQVQKNALFAFQTGIDNGEYKFEKYACECGCLYDKLVLLGEKDRYGLECMTKICPECGLVMTNPRMTQESYNKFYDTYYRQIYGGTSHAEDNFFTGQYEHGKKIYKYIKENYDMSRIHSVLEVGCGAGGILYAFNKMGIDNTKGIDVGSEYIDFGKGKGLDLESISSEDLVKRNRKYDLIILSHVLEHFLDIESEMNIIRELLADSGVLYVEVPGIKGIPVDYENNILRYLQNAHIRHFTYDTLKQLMGWNGWDPVVGDESIHSLFCKGKKRSTVKVNYFNDVMKAFSDMEKLYLSEISQEDSELRKVAEKEHEIMQTLDMWLTVSRTERNIVGYLRARGVQRVAIYGFGILGKQLYTELCMTGIEVSYVIDRKEFDSMEVKFYKPNADLPETDLIILTTVDDYVQIRREITKKAVLRWKH